MKCVSRPQGIKKLPFIFKSELLEFKNDYIDCNGKIEVEKIKNLNYEELEDFFSYEVYNLGIIHI